MISYIDDNSSTYHNLTPQLSPQNHNNLIIPKPKTNKEKKMPPPSPLSIKTSSVTRLIKEESYYRQETVRQQAVVANLVATGADEYELRQPVRKNLPTSPQFKKALIWGRGGSRGKCYNRQK